MTTDNSFIGLRRRGNELPWWSAFVRRLWKMRLRTEFFNTNAIFSPDQHSSGEAPRGPASVFTDYSVAGCPRRLHFHQTSLMGRHPA
jgi:hypothetical protein